MVLGLAALSLPAPSRADFDLNGNWIVGTVVLGFQILCHLDIVQTGTDLGVTGTCDFAGPLSLTGTIDVMSGAFNLGGNAGAICTMAGSLTLMGTATDNSNFTGTLNCGGLTGFVTGSRCGNGQLDPGEQCDTGTDVGTFGNCCASNCQYASNSTMCRSPFTCDPAEFCTGTSAVCPPDVKDPDDTPCDDGDPCATGKTCTGGVCTNGTPLSAGTTCLDSIPPCVDFQCDGAGSCQPVFTTSPCDDGDPCTTADTCSDGFCTGGPAFDCGPCQTCFSFEGCIPTPAQVCDTPAAPTAILSLVEGASPANTRLKWKWRGPSIDVFDFGDPRGTTSYDLCMYDHDPSSPSGLRVILEASVPPGNKWIPGSTGYRYSDPTLAADGMQSIVLKSGAAGKAKISLRAKGANLGAANLPAFAPVAVQVKASGGACWGANYAAPETDTPTKLRGKGGP